MTSTERLIAELEKLEQRQTPQGETLHLHLLNEARQFAFHDFRSESMTPKWDLMQLLQHLGGDDAEKLAQRVAVGEFDESQEEAETWARREERAGAEMGKFIIELRRSGML